MKQRGQAGSTGPWPTARCWHALESVLSIENVVQKTIGQVPLKDERILSQEMLIKACSRNCRSLELFEEFGVSVDLSGKEVLLPDELLMLIVGWYQLDDELISENESGRFHHKPMPTDKEVI